jgi:rubrerythrin
LECKDEVLVRDHPSATFEMLLQKAEREGRIGGKYQCPVCGMKFKKEKEASNCCKGIMR